MTMSLDDLCWAIACKLAQLLKDDEAGWDRAASRIRNKALDEGIDLGVDFESPESFAHSVLENMRFHIDLKQRFPNGVADFEHFEVAEELFWRLMPW